LGLVRDTVFSGNSGNIRAWSIEERGQDLAEYCLLTALVALVALGIVIHFAGGFQAIWNSANFYEKAVLVKEILK
jgi:Flp pilus assembly pilin Flp